MRRWILRLYPNTWRQRYGAELEAMLEDAGTRRGDDWDLLKGALAMRFSGLPRMIMMVVAGAMIPWAIGWAWWVSNPSYRAEAIVHFTTAVTPIAVNEAAQKVLSRRAVADVINKHQLFEVGTRYPMEDGVEMVRQNTRIRMGPHGQMTVAFQYAPPLRFA